MTDSFRDKFLAGVASSLGASAADLAAEREARYEQALRRQEAIRRQATTWADILYDKYVTDAVMRAYIKLPLADEIRYITGYHPQRLLPAPSKPIDLWGGLQDTLKDMMSSYVSHGYFVDTFFPNDISREFINFEPVPKLTRYQIEGGHFDMWDREPRRIAPFVSPTGRREPTFITPTGRFTYPHLTRPQEEGRKFHMAVITGADYAAVERQILAAMNRDSVRCLVVDLDSPGGEISANPQLDLYRYGFRGLADSLKDTYPRDYTGRFELRDDQVVDTAAGKRDKSYLKHDPSKTHKRRKRK